MRKSNPLAARRVKSFKKPVIRHFFNVLYFCYGLCYNSLTLITIWRTKMASSLNKVQLIGRLGKDPEVRSTPTGRTVTTITLATSETFGKDADRKEKTEWHKIILWDKLGQLAGNYLRKGRQVFIEGRITYRDYMDRDNIKRYVTEIVANSMVFLGSKDESAGGGRSFSNEPNADYAPEPAADFSSQDMDKYAASMQNLGSDDEVPF